MKILIKPFLKYVCFHTVIQLSMTLGPIKKLFQFILRSGPFSLPVGLEKIYEVIEEEAFSNNLLEDYAYIHYIKSLNCKGVKLNDILYKLHIFYKISLYQKRVKTKFYEY